MSRFCKDGMKMQRVGWERLAGMFAKQGWARSLIRSSWWGDLSGVVDYTLRKVNVTLVLELRGDVGY